MKKLEAKYIVKLTSSDNYIYEFNTEAKSPEEASIKALQRINNNGWDCYNYKITEIFELKR